MNSFKLSRIPRVVKLGLPLMIFVVAGSLGLSEVTDIKIKQKDEKVRKLTSEEAMAYQSKRREKPISMEEALEKVQKDLNIDDWENKRGPRPWEENFGTEKES